MKLRTHIVLFLLLIPLLLSAQELSVQSFASAPNDIISANDQVLDLNGGSCALVKIQVVDDIDRVEGNVIGGLVNRGTEKWVYLTSGTKEFRIFPKSHLPLTISCGKYGIDGLESKRVYILRLTSNQQGSATSRQKKEEKTKVEVTEPVSQEPVTYTEPEQPAPVVYDQPYQDYNYTYHSRKHSNPISFGIRAGANLAWTQFGDGYDDVGMIPSFHVGLSMDIPFSDNFYLNIALLYSGKGYKYKEVEKASAQYIDLPVQLSLRFGDIDETQFQINAGPYAAFGIGGTIKSENSDKEQKFFDYYKRFDYGVVAGIGLIFSSHYYIGANFQLGFGDYRNRNIGISLGYNF